MINSNWEIEAISEQLPCRVEIVAFQAMSFPSSQVSALHRRPVQGSQG